MCRNTIPRVITLCPICHKKISLNGSEYRSRNREGKEGWEPCCSKACGTLRRQETMRKKKIKPKSL
jgi:hypothetical protein